MRTNVPTRDPSTDAGAFASAQHGAQATVADAAFDEGAPVFDRANDVISNNQNGGAGFFAEAHHTASLNIDANAKDASVSADRLGSTAFGSPDIVLNSGEQFNPKFYETAGGSYCAGAELTDDGGHVAAKYAGQTIIVPSDQLEQVQHLNQQAIAEAFATGDVAKAHALESVQYDDHIHSGGVESMPLTYHDAQVGAADIHDEVMPDYVGEDTGLLESAGEGALLSASIAIATTIGPQLISDAMSILGGNRSKEDAIARLKDSLGDTQARSAVVWASARGIGAAALTYVEAFDPIGAAFLVNFAIDTIQLSTKVSDGAIRPDEFGGAMLAKATDRAGYTALTAGAFWVLGPVGLLVPIIVRRTVSDAKLQNEAMHAWHDVAGAMRAEFESRVKAASLLDAVEQRYRSAEASSDSAQRTTKRIAQDLSNVRKLLGYNGGSSPITDSGISK